MSVDHEQQGDLHSIHYHRRVGPSDPKRTALYGRHLAYLMGISYNTITHARTKGRITSEIRDKGVTVIFDEKTRRYLQEEWSPRGKYAPKLLDYADPEAFAWLFHAIGDRLRETETEEGKRPILELSRLLGLFGLERERLYNDASQGDAFDTVRGGGNMETFVILNERYAARMRELIEEGAIEPAEEKLSSEGLLPFYEGPEPKEWDEEDYENFRSTSRDGETREQVLEDLPPEGSTPEGMESSDEPAPTLARTDLPRQVRRLLEDYPETEDQIRRWAEESDLSVAQIGDLKANLPEWAEEERQDDPDDFTSAGEKVYAGDDLPSEDVPSTEELMAKASGLSERLSEMEEDFKGLFEVDDQVARESRLGLAHLTVPARAAYDEGDTESMKRVVTAIDDEILRRKEAIETLFGFRKWLEEAVRSEEGRDLSGGFLAGAMSRLRSLVPSRN